MSDNDKVNIKGVERLLSHHKKNKIKKKDYKIDALSDVIKIMKNLKN